MSFIKSRLRRAEASVRSANCAECGLPPDGLGRIVLSDEWLPDYPEELCPKCDRRLWFIIEIVEPATVEGEGF